MVFRKSVFSNLKEILSYGFDFDFFIVVRYVHMEISFLGREDGLGNRLLEITFLEYVADKNNIKINYYWNNNPKKPNRNYPILIDSKNVQILIDSNAISNFENHFNKKSIFALMDKEDWAKYASLITPKFAPQNKNHERVSVHLRGGDRIIRFNKEFIKNYRTKPKNDFMYTNLHYKYLQKKSLRYLNSKKPEQIFICSDSEREKDNYIKKLNFQYLFKCHNYEERIPNVYKDFFNLAFSKEIVMASKFSSFAIMASLVGQTSLMVHKGITVPKHYSKYVDYY